MSHKLLLEYIKESSIINEAQSSAVSNVGGGDYSYVMPDKASGVAGMVFTKADQDLAKQLGYVWQVLRAPSKVKFFLGKIPKTQIRQMMFPKQSRVQKNVESGKYIEINRNLPSGSEPRIPSRDMWNAADADLENFYNFVTSFEDRGTSENVLKSLALKLNSEWRPSFKKAYEYLESAPEDKKRDLNRRLNKVYRLYFLNILKNAKKAFTRQYPKDAYTYKGKKLGNMRKLYDYYIKLFS